MKLTNNNINDFIKKIEDLFPNEPKLRIMAEEVLLIYQEKYSDNIDFDYKIKKFLGITKITINVQSEQYNPFKKDEEEEFSILNSMVDYGDNQPSYRYKDNTNEVTIAYQKKKNFKIPGGKLTIAVLLAIVLGLLAHYLPENIFNFLINVIVDPLSARLPKLVSALTIPLIFVSILAGICALEEVSSLSAIGARILKRFAITIIFIQAITLPLCFIFFNGAKPSGEEVFEINTLIDIVLQIIPTNFFTPFTEGNAVQVVFIAFVAGVAILLLGDKANKVKNAIPELNVLVMQMMKIVAEIIPYTVFLSLFKTFAISSISSMLSFWRIIVVNYAANIIVSIILLVRLKVLRKINLRSFISTISPLLFTALTTSSTSTGLPTEYKICEEDLKIDKKVYNFWIPIAHAMFSVSVVIPLMAGAFFTAYQANMTISFSKLILIVLMIIELTIASPKIPGGIVATYTLLFTEIGLPLDSLGILMAANIFIINFEVMNEVLIKYCDLIDLHSLLSKEK